ncbi:type II secretion system F family protein [Aeromicrobium sp. P5_D10]
MTVLAAGMSIIAVVLWRPAGSTLVRHRLGDGRFVVMRVVPWAVVGAVVALALVAGLPGPRLVVAVTVLGVAGFAMRQLRAAKAQQRLRQRRHEVSDLLGLMAAELRAGLLPAQTLTGLCRDFAFLAPAARAADLGGDVAAALREAGGVPGREVLREVGAAWHVAERAGAPLAVVLDRLEQAVRDGREVDREVQAGVAPARATGRLMAMLPLVGLMLGSGLGGSPVSVLTSSWIGSLCAAGGCLLACLGVAWIDRIALSAERVG